MSHTPGPWWVEKTDHPMGEGREVHDDWGLTANVNGDSATSQANAALISAAPDLLEACEMLLTYLGDWDDPEDETCVAARKAIAKAKGVSMEGTNGEERSLD